jgi:IS5 family transposase
MSHYRILSQLALSIAELQKGVELDRGARRDLAAVYAGLEDKDQAFEWIEKDFQARSGSLARTRWETPLRMGLPQ